MYKFKDRDIFKITTSNKNEVIENLLINVISFF